LDDHSNGAWTIIAVLDLGRNPDQEDQAEGATELLQLMRDDVTVLNYLRFADVKR
jgi:hypothetical protein